MTDSSRNGRGRGDINLGGGSERRRRGRCRRRWRRRAAVWCSRWWACRTAYWVAQVVGLWAVWPILPLRTVPTACRTARGRGGMPGEGRRSAAVEPSWLSIASSPSASGDSFSCSLFYSRFETTVDVTQQLGLTSPQCRWQTNTKPATTLQAQRCSTIIRQLLAHRLFAFKDILHRCFD